MRNIFTLLFVFTFSNIYACKHCEIINNRMYKQHKYYKELLDSDFKFDRSYIEGKADAYREMPYIIELLLYEEV